MSFLHPTLLFAGLAVGLPVLIHWLTRPRPVRLSLSTVRFVMQAVQQRRGREPFRGWVVIFFRPPSDLPAGWGFLRAPFGEEPPLSPGGLCEGVCTVTLPP